MIISNREHIIQLIEEDEWMMNILRSAQTLELPDWWICAGFVRSKIWDTLHEFKVRTPLLDVDVIYYEPRDCMEETEKKLEAKLRAIHPDVPWSVKNQARMHKINRLAPYLNSENAMAAFPESATALGVSLSKSGKLVLSAPCGVEDVLNMQVKPTPLFETDKELRAVYERRIAEKNWKAVWPKVQYT